MYIPTKLITERYYVATKLTQALYSSKTLGEAMKCIERYKEHSPYEFNTIKGIIRVTSNGRNWIESNQLTQLLSPIPS